MRQACLEFQSVLADRLAAPTEAAALDLNWHEHLLFCGECRSLLAREHALDELLSSLPRPRLPRQLVERVLAALAAAQKSESSPSPDLRLDELLGVLDPPAPPSGLAERVLLGVRGRAEEGEPRDSAMEDLLGALPEPEAESGLASRILDGLAPHRGPVRPARPVRKAWRSPVRLVAAVAALVSLAFLVAERVREEPVIDPYASDPEFLSLLPLLEAWEPLDLSDPDVYLGELDPVDWALVIEGGDTESGSDFRGQEERDE